MANKHENVDNQDGLVPAQMVPDPPQRWNKLSPTPWKGREGHLLAVPWETLQLDLRCDGLLICRHKVLLILCGEIVKLPDDKKTWVETPQGCVEVFQTLQQKPENSPSGWSSAKVSFFCRVQKSITAQQHDMADDLWPPAHYTDRLQVVGILYKRGGSGNTSAFRSEA